MLSLKEIKESYPSELQNFPRYLLREYLQYKILEIIYNSDLADKLVFIGGTALRIVHSNQRFSEDLDFDNFDMSRQEFEKMSELIKKGLELEGFIVEIRNVLKGAFRCYIKIPDLLYAEGLSPLKNEKITIQVDTTAQGFNFDPKLVTLDKFDVYTQIKVVPTDILLSQKFYAILNRKRPKGRDFFDVDYLINNKKISPNFDYLKQKLNIDSSKELRDRLVNHLKDVDLGDLAKDVENFLFNPEHKARVLKFNESLESWEL